MEFKKIKLEDLCDITSSKRIYLSEYQNSGIPFYRGKEIIELSDFKPISTNLYISESKYDDLKEKFGTPSQGDILMTAVGTLGKTWQVDKRNFYFKDGNLIWFLNFKNYINSRYLLYIFKSKKFENIINEISIGSTQRAITIQQMKKVEINIPKRELQDKIVNILDYISSKIRLNNQINDNLIYQVA